MDFRLFPKTHHCAHSHVDEYHRVVGMPELGLNLLPGGHFHGGWDGKLNFERPIVCDCLRLEKGHNLTFLWRNGAPISAETINEMKDNMITIRTDLLRTLST